MANKENTQFSNLNFVWELAKTIIGVLLFVVFFRYFILQPYLVIGQSMEPNFHNGDYLFVDELSYKFRAPQRGEVVVFRHPEDQCTAYINAHSIAKNIFEGPCVSYIKRVIGLPGETVNIQNGDVKITNKEHPNGIVLNEKYIEKDIKTLGNETVTLGKDQYFVLGDNREPNASSDSREWGPLTPKYIVGRAWIRLYPAPTFGLIKKANY